MTAYLTGTSSGYTLHIYGYGRMKDFTHTNNWVYPYSTTPWASYLYYNNSRSDSRIRNVYIHNGVKNIGSYFLCGDNMTVGYKSTSLNTLSIAETVREIGAYAFFCNVPSQIVIPAGVRRIWNSAFTAVRDTDNRTVNAAVTCASSVNHIDSSAFLNTTRWRNASAEFPVLGDNCIVNYNGTGGNITIPDGTKSLTFYNAAASKKQAVTGVNMPPSLRSLGTSAFNGFTSLTSVVLPNSVKLVSQNAFANCSGLQSITLSSSLKTLCEKVFINCSSLRNVYIPASVERISSTEPLSGGGICAASESPFYGCSGSLKIYCGASSKPAGFDTYWNYVSNSATATVYWDVTPAEYAQATGGD